MEFRYAERRDVGLVLQFIRELADYEHMLDEVVATPELLEEWLFDRKKAEVVFAVEDGVEVGFALFFHNFSTFLGRAGIYLEDLYVKPAYRGRGFGKALLTKLARAEVRTSGVVVTRLEPSEHRLLPVDGRGADEGLDRLPHQRRHAAETRRGRLTHDEQPCE